MITSSTADGWHTLALSGELDLASVQTLDRAAQELELDAAEGVALDMGSLAFIDSTGLRGIVRLHDRCTAHGAELRVTSGSPAVHRIFEVVDLLGRMPFQVSQPPDGDRRG